MSPTLKPKLNNSNNSPLKDGLPVFELQDASVRGGEMLMSDPRKWQELEDEYLEAIVFARQKAHVCLLGTESGVRTLRFR